MAKTTIELEDSTKQALQDERLPHESNYNQTIERLLGDSSSGQLWTEQEIRDMIQQEIEAVARQ